MSLSKHIFAVKNQFFTGCFLLVCGFQAWAQPSFTADFAPDTIGPGSISTLTFTIDNTASGSPVTDLAFINTLPAGVSIASPSEAVSECINGLVTAPEGGSTINLTEGRVSAGSLCSVRVNVTSSVIGLSTNVSGDLTSSAGNSGTASADLTVASDRPGFSKSFSPSIVNFGDRSTLTFTLDNSLNPNDTSNLSFVDNLPIGMRVADPSGLVNNCPQSTGNEVIASIGSSQISYSFFGFIFPGFPFLEAGSTCTISVDIEAQARGRLDNITGVLTSSEGGPTVTSGKAGAVLTVNSVGDLQLTQDFVDDPVQPGDPVDLTFNLSSLNRSSDIDNITFTNDLDAALSGLVATGLPINDVCGTGSTIAGSSFLSLTGASLGPEESCSFTVTLQVPIGASTGAYPNTTSQPGGDISGQPTNGSASTDVLFINAVPQLSKSFSPNSAAPGQTVSMDFTLVNPSTSDAATDISFSDNISGFLSGSQVINLPAADFCGAGSTAFTSIVGAQTFFNISGGILAAGDSCTFSVELTTSNNTPPATYTNITEPVSATMAGQQLIGNSASADLTIEDIPQLSMLFTNDPVTPGVTVTLQYRIAGAEEGSLNATDITFSHDLDATLSGLAAVGLPLNDVCGAGSQISGTSVLTLTGGSISNSSVCVFDLTLQVPAAAASGDYVSTTSDLNSTVNGSGTSASPATDTLQVSTLSFSQEFIDDPALPGASVTLQYTIENLSPSNASSDMFFTHNLSAVLPGLTYSGGALTDACGVGSSLSGTNFIIFTGGNLNPGASCIFSITLDIPIATPSNQYPSVTSQLTATVAGSAVQVDAASDVLIINDNLLLFDKSYLDNPVSPGNTSTLSFTLTNSDPTNAVTGLSFTDDLDASLTGLVASGLPLNDVCGTGSQISGTSLLTLTGGNLAAGASCTFDVIVTVPAISSTGVYTNTTSQVSGLLNGLAVIGDPAIDDLLVGFINFSKSFAGPVNTGETTTLNFTINNSDNNAQNGLAFSDDLDAVLSGLVAVGLPLNDVCGMGSQISGTSLLTFTGGQLPSNTSCSFDVTVQVPAGLSDSSYTNVTSELFQTGLPIADSATADLQVNGIPFIDLSVTSIDFGAIEVGNAAAIQTTTVTNTGTADLTVSNVTAATAPFNADASGSCPATPFVLAPGNNCTLAFGFSPTTAGGLNQNIDLVSDAGGSGLATLQLLGTGLQAQLTLSPNPLDFGVVELNTNSTVTAVTLTNNGTADLDVTSVTAASGDFALTTSTCGAAPFSLTPTSSCTLSYQFSPTITGAQSQNISLISDSPTSPDILVLQGEGVQADLTLSANQVNFPNTTINTTSTEQLITISNNGVIDLNISNITAANPPFIQSGGNCPALPIVLAVNASCTLGYQFSPSATGPFNQTLSLTSNAVTSPDSFDLIGEGIEPGLQLSDVALDFQAVNINSSSASLSLTLTNTGAADLQVSSITAAAAPFVLSGGDCGTAPLTLSANQSCNLTYLFQPISSGNFNQTINVQSNAATSPDSFALLGVGLDVVLISSEIAVNFGYTAINELQNQTITLSNNGTDDVIITDILPPNAPFSVDFSDCGPLPINLIQASSCELIIGYITGASPASSNVVIISNDPDSPLEIVLNGSGLNEPVFVPTLDSFGLWLMLALMLLVANYYFFRTRRLKLN